MSMMTKQQNNNSYNTDFSTTCRLTIICKAAKAIKCDKS